MASQFVEVDPMDPVSIFRYYFFESTYGESRLLSSITY